MKTKQLFYGSREFRLTICNEKFNGEAGDTPQAVADYLQNAVKNSPFYRADRENFINHPGGDPSPSEADIRTTRDFVRTGQMLKIEVLDHIILGHPESGKGFSSLRELGHFY